jgi:hypothetical protein
MDSWDYLKINFELKNKNIKILKISTGAEYSLIFDNNYKYILLDLINMVKIFYF